MQVDSGIRKTQRYFKNSQYRIKFYQLLRDYVVDGRMAFPEIFRRLAERKAQRKDRDAIVYQTLVNLIDVENEDVMMAMMEVLPREEILLLESTPKDDMSAGFDQIIMLAEGKASVQQTVFRALAMGVLSIISGIPTLFLQLSILVPEYLKTLPADHWPQSTRFVLTLHDLLIVNYWVLPTIIVGLTVLVIISLRWPVYGIRRYLDYLPPWSFQRGIQSSSFLISLGSLLGQRVSFPQALDKINDIAPDYLHMHLQLMEEKLDDNLEPEKVIDTELLPKERMDYIRDFVGQSSFSTVLKQQGNSEIEGLPGRMKALMVTMITIIIMSVIFLNVYISFSGQQVNAAAKDYYQSTYR